MNNKVLVERLLKLKREHHECEDCWYSCPKSEDGCCNEGQGDECNCGADTHNAEIDSICSALSSQAQEEPSAWMTDGGSVCAAENKKKPSAHGHHDNYHIPLYRSPRPHERQTLQQMLEVEHDYHGACLLDTFHNLHSAGYRLYKP
jgi:hypothetical protein